MSRSVPIGVRPPPRVAVTTFFFITGFISATWIARIPAAAQALSLSTASVGTLLLFSGVGAVSALQIVGRLIDRFSSARVATVFGLLYALALSGLALAPVPVALGVALFLFGFTAGAVDVAMNAQGVEVERRFDKTIMGSLHGAWSLGGLAGAGLGAAAASLGIGLLPHFLAGSTLAVAALLWARRGQIPDHSAIAAAADATPQAPAKRRRLFSLPPRSLRLLGVIAFCGAIGEGAASDWSGLFIHKNLGAGQGIAAVGFAAFSATMLTGRFAGDYLVQRFGRVPVVRTAGVVAVVGMLLAIVPRTVPAAIIGFGVVGLGISVVMPTVFSAAGMTRGISSGRAVAMVATIGYSGFLVGPPVLGWFAKLTSLEWSLALVSGLFVLIALFASSLRRPAAVEPATQRLPGSAAV